MQPETSQKIAILIPSLTIGGVQRWAVNLSRELIERGCEIDLVLVSGGGLLRKQVDPRVKVVDLKANRALFALPALVRYLNQHAPSALLSAQTHINVIALWAAVVSQRHTRVIVTERNHMSTASANGRMTDRIRSLLARWFYSRSFAIVAVSQGVADDMSLHTGIPRERVAVIYNPVVSPSLATASVPPPLPWIDRGKYKLILAIGRLEIQKDFGALISAFDRVRRQENVRLLILGDGSCRKQLEYQIDDLGLKDLVALPGFVDDPPSFLRIADLFVLSSRWEGLSTVLIEALACGVPVVSTDCPSSPSEILEGGKYGLLVPVGDSRRLAEGIIKTLRKPRDRAVLMKRAMHFSVEQSANQYLAVLRQSESA